MSKKRTKKRVFNHLLTLKRTPILCEFVKNIFKFSGRLDPKFDLCKNLYFIRMCGCGQEDCATLYLKNRRKWKKIPLGVEIVNTNKGVVLLHFGQRGHLKLEALDYVAYPYKSEIERVTRGDFSKPTQEEKEALSDYFKELHKKEAYATSVGGIELIEIQG